MTLIPQDSNTPIIIVSSNRDSSEPCGTADCNDGNYILVNDSSILSYSNPRNDFSQKYPQHSHEINHQSQFYNGTDFPYRSDRDDNPIPIRFQPNNNNNSRRSFYQLQVPRQIHQSSLQSIHTCHDTDAESVASYKTVRFTTTGVEPVDFVYYVKSVFGDILRNECFSTMIVLVILLNAVLMGVGTLPSIANNPRKSAVFENIDVGFLVLFTIEVSMQLFYRGCGFFSDGWLIFDLLIICSSWMLAPLQVVRVFRIFRILRLIPKVQELKDVVEAVTSSMPKMVAIFALIQLQYYIFAVMFTQLFGTAYKEGVTSIDYFSRLDKTYFTLFQLMTLDSWSSITRELMKKYVWAWLPMTLYVLSTTFIILNLIIAVICDSISKISKSRDESISKVKTPSAKLSQDTTKQPTTTQYLQKTYIGLNKKLIH
jgi:Ion transport protein